MNDHPAAGAVAALWRGAGLPDDALGSLQLIGTDPVLLSSFRVGTAAQVSLACAAQAAQLIRQDRCGRGQTVTVAAADAAFEACGWFSVDGVVPGAWDPIAGLYRCAQGGWVRLHTNFSHHRDGVLRLLGLPEGPDTSREAVVHALTDWRAEAFESAAAQQALCVSALRSFEQWDAHPQGQAVAGLEQVAIRRIGDAPPRPLERLGALSATARPLAGLRMLDLTRILAGPTAGRTLAAWGADVLLLNAPHLPNIAAIAETSRGKLSAHLDLRSSTGRETLWSLLGEADVFAQGYRPGGLAELGFSTQTIAERAPGVVCMSLSAYGPNGPWASRRGFDSLVQTASGFNHAEAAVCGSTTPRPLPMQILDIASGWLMAFGALAALRRQSIEGGTWQVEVSLAGTGHWLRQLGRVADGFAVERPDLSARAQPFDSGFGALRALPCAVQFSQTPARWTRPSMPPGTHPARWPQRGID